MSSVLLEVVSPYKCTNGVLGPSIDKVELGAVVFKATHVHLCRMSIGPDHDCLFLLHLHSESIANLGGVGKGLKEIFQDLLRPGRDN